jgi:hypothetical protein
MDFKDQIDVLTGGVHLARMMLEERRMAKATGLTKLSGLVGSLKDTDALAGSLASRLASAVGSLNDEMGTTRSIVETVESARDALREINKAVLPGDNGGPPLVSGNSSAPAVNSTVESKPAEVAQLGEVKGGNNAT